MRLKKVGFLFLFSRNVNFKITTKIVKNVLNFLCARIAAINLFQINLDKPWNYI